MLDHVGKDHQVLFEFSTIRLADFERFRFLLKFDRCRRRLGVAALPTV